MADADPRAVGPGDDAPHEHGGERGWSERLSFNFFDRASGLGGLAAMEFWPGDRRAESSLSLFLPEGAFATSLARAQNAKRAELSVGRLVFEIVKPLVSFRVRCKDVALVFPTVGGAKVPQAGERHGAAAQIDVDLSFERTAGPSGTGARRTDMNEQHFMSVVSSGFFVQPGHMTGLIRIGNRTLTFDGYGFRHRVWGVRDDAAGIWRAVTFGAGLAVSALELRLGDKTFTDTVVFRDGMRHPATRGGDGLDLIDEAGERYALTEEVLATIPVRPEDPHRARSMVRFRLGNKEALGLTEQPGG